MYLLLSIITKITGWTNLHKDPPLGLCKENTALPLELKMLPIMEILQQPKQIRFGLEDQTKEKSWYWQS